MKVSLKILIAGLFMATVITGVLFARVSAEDSRMNDQHIENIRSNCVTAKNTLTQLHASDALLRVNMGQLYELMTTKLMDRFNSRLSNNNYDNSSLTAVTSAYNQKLDAFRNDYKDYEVQLAVALKIDCLNQPVSFYDAVAASREKRTQVHVDVARLNQFLNDYKTAMNAFENDYLAKQGTKQP